MRQAFEPGHNLETEPDAAYLHSFAPNEAMTLGYDEEGNIYCRLRVNAIRDKFVSIDFWVKGLTETPLKGELELGRPTVMLRRMNNEPSLTLTLRKIEDGRAFVQVTAHPSIPQRAREAV
jgi:hypothetical protein